MQNSATMSIEEKIIRLIRQYELTPNPDGFGWHNKTIRTQNFPKSWIAMRNKLGIADFFDGNWEKGFTKAIKKLSEANINLALLYDALRNHDDELAASFIL